MTQIGLGSFLLPTLLLKMPDLVRSGGSSIPSPFGTRGRGYKAVKALYAAANPPP